MKKIKVSIIVPVYNSEKYLKKCLDSLINQTLAEIEIICVNDGSTDFSPEILRNYSKKDERIKIITQKNKDVGAARGRGVKAAKGEYIAFADNDDCLALDALERLYNNAINNNSDIVMFGFVFCYPGYERIYPHYYNLKKRFDENTDFNNFTLKAEDIKDMVMNTFFAPWFKFYKSEFLKNDDFYFKENITYPDVPLHVQVMLKANKISFCPKTLYFYRRDHHESMLLISKDTDRVFDIFIVIDEVENFLNENNFMKDYYNEFIEFKMELITFWFFKCGKSYREQYFEKSKKELINLNLSKEVLEQLPNKYSEIYLNIIHSESYHEVDGYNYNDLKKKYALLDKNYNKLKYHHNNLIESRDNLKIIKKNLIKENKEIKKQNRLLGAKNLKLHKKNSEIKKELNSIYYLKSWKITKLLRKIIKRGKKLDK